MPMTPEEIMKAIAANLPTKTGKSLEELSVVGETNPERQCLYGGGKIWPVPSMVSPCGKKSPIHQAHLCRMIHRTIREWIS